jgi:hypothetical protein
LHLAPELRFVHKGCQKLQKLQDNGSRQADHSQGLGLRVQQSHRVLPCCCSTATPRTRPQRHTLGYSNTWYKGKAATPGHTSTRTLRYSGRTGVQPTIRISSTHRQPCHSTTPTYTIPYSIQARYITGLERAPHKLFVRARMAYWVLSSSSSHICHWGQRLLHALQGCVATLRRPGSSYKQLTGGSPKPIHTSMYTPVNKPFSGGCMKHRGALCNLVTDHVGRADSCCHMFMPPQRNYSPIYTTGEQHTYCFTTTTNIKAPYDHTTATNPTAVPPHVQDNSQCMTLSISTPSTPSPKRRPTPARPAPCVTCLCQQWLQSH